MKSNARRFLDAFASIEDELAEEQDKRQNGGKWHSFTDLVRNSKLLRPAQVDDLLQYAKLRNAIVHAAYRDGSPLADPRDDVVQSIESILRILTRPPLLVEVLFGRPAPAVLQSDDAVEDFFALIREKDYSQVPVRIGGNWSLLTTNVLARWLASHPQDVPGSLRKMKVEDVLDLSESGDEIAIVDRGISVVDAIRIFAGDADISVEPPAAIMVRGRSETEPALLCTRADLVELHASIRD